MKNKTIIGIVLIFIILVGCSNKIRNSTDGNKELAVIEEINVEVKELVKVSEEGGYQGMIKRSLISSGNNYRIKKVIEKAKKGEDVNIAYIGGSITEGAGATNGNSYATKSFEMFKELFVEDSSDNVKFINAGMGGTPSSLGIIRYQRDVIEQLDTLPDIVFIEFAVNDYQETTSGRAYESMIKDILNTENEPAVILLFSVFESRWNLQDLYIPIGNAYQLPMISIKDAVVPALDEEKLITDKEFFADSYHPTNYGHKIMADCIKNFFEIVDKEETSQGDIQVPTSPVLGTNFVGLKMIDRRLEDPKVQIEERGFVSLDQELVPMMNFDGEKSFPHNWKHSSEDSSDSFILKTECKNMMLVYKESSSSKAGSIDVYIDGRLSQTINSYSEGGWNNAVPILILDEEDSIEHTFEFRMSEGSEEKEFSILALGYTNESTQYEVPPAYDQARINIEYGAINPIEYYSDSTKTTRKANVLLPAGYDEQKKYPVLYLLHGIGGDENEWLYGKPQYVLGNLVAHQEAKEMIVVMPNVRARVNDEKNPKDVFSLDHYQAFDNFINDLTNDLMPYIEDNYSVEVGRENTAIAGLSMGGREALYIGFTIPETFGYIGAFCPAFGIFEYSNNNVREEGLFTEENFTLPKELETMIMIVKGKKDGVVKDEPIRYHNALVKNNIKHIYYEVDGGHDFNVWNNGLYHFAKRIFK